VILDFNFSSYHTELYIGHTLILRWKKTALFFLLLSMSLCLLWFKYRVTFFKWCCRWHILVSHIVLRFVALLATEYDEVLLGYQLGQMVERWKKQCFEDLRTRTEMVFKTLVFSPLNHLTWLIAQKNFIISHSAAATGILVSFSCIFMSTSLWCFLFPYLSGTKCSLNHNRLMEQYFPSSFTLNSFQ
jgi:hypothetical protein